MASIAWATSAQRLYDSLGQYDKAIDHHTRSLAIEKEIGNREGVAGTLGNLGILHLYSLQDAPVPPLTSSSVCCRRLRCHLGRSRDRRAAHRLWRLRRTTYTIARALQHAHARLAQPASALLAAERARSRAFELLLAQQRVQFSTGQAAAGKPAALDQCAALVVFSHIDATTLFACGS